MGHRVALLSLLGLLTLGYAAKCPRQRTSPGREIICYTSTNDVKALKDSICRCTTLVHQGHDLKDLSTTGITELQKSWKDMNPVLQFILAVNDNDGTLKTSAQVRLEATARVMRILKEVDGIELNVTAGTKERLVHFVQGLKTEMVRKSKEKRIIMVLPTKPQDLAKQFDLKALSKYVDLFTIPTHYLVEEDEAFRTFHPSRLIGLFDMLNTDSIIDLVTGLGAEKRKILVSLPASVYKFTLENNQENAPRAPAKTKQPVQISRSEMCETMEKGEWIVERDEDLTAPYAFKDDTWIAFEDKISVGIKGKYALLRDLAGLGIHNVEKDSKSKCGKSLTEEVYHSFTDNKRKTRQAVLTSLHDDLQETPNSYPSHVKSSEFRIVRVVDTDGRVHANRENMQTEFSCPRQGYFVHPKSCNRFYRCVKFNQGIEDYSVFEFDCPAGLAFDERTEVCVWPGSITEGSACPGSSEIAPTRGPKFTCPEQPGYYADPQNCRFFYACYDLGEGPLTAYEFRCPYGLVFDETKLICEWPYLVPSCGGGNYSRKEYETGSGSFSSIYGGYDDQPGSSGDVENGGGRTTAQTGYGGNVGQGVSLGSGYDGSSYGNQEGSSQSGYNSGHENYPVRNEGPTTVPSGYSGSDPYSGSSGDGHATVPAGSGRQDGYGGSSRRPYDNRHATGPSRYDESGHPIVQSGHDEQGYTTGHSEYSGSGLPTVHAGYDGNGRTTVHSGYVDNTRTTLSSSGFGHNDADGGSSEDRYRNRLTTIHPGYGEHALGHDVSKDANGRDITSKGNDNQHTTGYSGYSGHAQTTVHSGSQGMRGGPAGGYTGYTTQSGYGGGGHTTAHAGFFGDGRTTVHPGFGDSNLHGGITEEGYSGRSPVHSGYGGDGRTTIHSGYTGREGTAVYSDGGEINTHAGTSGAGYSDRHGTTKSEYHGDRHSSGHTGFGNNNARGGSSQGEYGGYVTQSIGNDDARGGLSGSGPAIGHTTIPSGFEGGRTHAGTSVVGFNDGHTTTHSGQSGRGHSSLGSIEGHSGSPESGYAIGHTTVHSGFGNRNTQNGVGFGGEHATAQSGSGGSGRTTVHLGLGDSDAHGGLSESGYAIGHTAIPSGFEDGRTHVGTSVVGFSDRGTATHFGHGGRGQSGLGGIEAHNGSPENGYAIGRTTVHSGFGNRNTQIGVGSGGEHATAQSGYDGSGHTTVHSGHGDSDAHDGLSNSEHVNGHTTGHSGFEDGRTHVGTSEVSFGDGHATLQSPQGGNGLSTVHSGFGNGNVHGGSSEREYSNIYTTHLGDNSGSTGSSSHVLSSDAGYSGFLGVSHPTGYSEQYRPTGEDLGRKESSGNRYQTGEEKPKYINLGTGAFTGQTSDVYGVGSPVSQHGGQIAPTVAPGIAHNIGVGNSEKAGSTIYYGNFGSGERGGYTNANGHSVVSTGSNTESYNDHTSLRGPQGVPSSDSTFYHQDHHKASGSSGSYAGGISTGSITATPGVIGTSDLTSGTVYSHGDASGSVLTGPNKQGVLISGSAQPGYVHTHSGTPGYVVANGVKTTYDDGSAKGHFSQGVGTDEEVVTGPQATGVVLTGHSGSRTYLADHTPPGVIVHSAARPGTSISAATGEQYSSGGLSTYSGTEGSSRAPNAPKNPFIVDSKNEGYKTNEYHDNGGRGTIRYNNGEVTHKYTEDDVRFHQSKFGTLPEFDAKNVQTSSVTFTKTGPTKTGITTAQLGGSGTYVSSNARSKPTITSNNIGANAFSTGSGYSGDSRQTIGSDYTDTEMDISKISVGSTITNSDESASGYSYDKPKVEFNPFGISSATKAPATFGKHDISVRPTSPGPYLDVHVYNNPSLPTSSPIGFTTGPLESFRTTVFEAARIPSSVSTVRPVIDTGYNSVISSTKYPINVDTNIFDNRRTTGYSANSLSEKGDSAIDINGSFQPHLSTGEHYEPIPPAVGVQPTGYGKSRRPSTAQSVITYSGPAISEQTNRGFIDSSDYPETNDYSKQTDGTFGQRIYHSSVKPTSSYQTPIFTPSTENYNGPTSTIAPAIGLTYRPPFRINISEPALRIPAEGYSHSKPSIKYVSTTSPSVTDEYQIVDGRESNTRYTGGSPTNIDFSKSEGEKLNTNYNRGSTKFIPRPYEDYGGDGHEETTLSTIGYSPQESYSQNSGQSYASDEITLSHKSQSGSYGRGYTTPSYELKTQSQGFGNRLETVDARDYSIIEGNLDTSSNHGVVESTTHLPISISSLAPSRQSSYTRGPSSRGPTSPVVTTYSGGYGRGSSTLSYAATTPKSLEKQKGRGKVIVKFSDLHPLLLGKLGAECTCKADPFASFRGDKPLPIDSSKGRVDLRNYDESEVYVDLESSKENGDYYSSEDITKSDYDDGEYETPIIAVFDRATPSPKGAAITWQGSSTTCRPISSSTRASPASTYSRGIDGSFFKNDVSSSASFTNERGVGNFRAGKNLDTSKGSSPKALTTKGSTFDRYGPGGLRGFDETLQGASDCARPGLFRHPNYCNKFYVCHWDEWKKKFTLHVFNCPVHLTFDNGASACNWPSKGPACQDDNLLV